MDRMETVELVRAGPTVRAGDVLGFLVVRNEHLRLPAMLEHHRRLGVDQFLIVDNGSDDGTLDILNAMPDVRLYRTNDRYGASQFGLGWLHPLLDDFAHNHWTLTIDADELFIFPHCERLGLHHFCHFLDKGGADSVFAILLDMYSDKSIAATSYQQGHSLISTCQFFDPGLYQTLRRNVFPTLELHGGPRRRRFWQPDTPFVPPAVSKVPLVKWQRGYRYTSSTHNMFPAPRSLSGISAALLHFKFLSDFHDRAKREVARGEHFAGGREYNLYLKELEAEPELSLLFSGSVRYQNSEQLISLQLCRTSKDFEQFATVDAANLQGA
jgi:glycosyltransferase involved in cell wall biosynthesis